MPEVLERPDFQRAPRAQQGDASWVPPAPPEGLETALHGHDERSARAEMRRQIAAMEAELGRLFASAFPRTGIEFGVPAPGGGPRVLGVDELEGVRDSLAGRLREARAELGERTRVEQRNRVLIDEMAADPESHKWVRVSNEDIGEPGCRHWHSRPKWGPLGLLLNWWRVVVSSGCPLSAGLAAPPEMAKKRKRKRRRERSDAAPPQANPRAADGAPEAFTGEAASRPTSAGRPRSGGRADGPPPPPWGSFPLSEIVVFVASVLLLGGFFVGPPRGPVMLGAGLVLGSLAGLELSVREHFSGYRSHTMLIAGAAGIAVTAALIALAGVPPVAGLAAGAAAFAAAAYLLAGAFRRRSGAAFKVR